MKNDIMVQANALTLSRYNFSKTEKNVLYFLLKKVRQEYIEGSMERQKWEDYLVKIPVSAFAKILDENHTADARKALRSLRHKDFEVEDEEGNWLNVGLINFAKFDSKTKLYNVQVSKELMPYLVELVRCYTAYDLTVAMALRSKYAQRFYEICCQFKNLGRFYLSQKKIRDMFKLEKKYLQNQDFRRKVLDVAKKELEDFYREENSDIWFEFNQVGKGEKIQYSFQIHCRRSRRQQEEVQQENVERLYIVTRFRVIFPKDPKYVSRVMARLELEVEKVRPIYEKLVHLEKDKRGADLARLLRYILREDFGID